MRAASKNEKRKSKLRYGGGGNVFLYSDSTLDDEETIEGSPEDPLTFGDLIEFLQERLHELRTFYRLIEQVGAKKFAIAIQKYGQPPPRKPETYYISPDVYKIQNPLDLFTIMHNYCLQKIKNFLSVSCAIKDTGRHELEDGKVIINDFRVKFGSRKTYVEYTSGGRAAMRKVIQKIAENRNSETVLLVGLEELPRRRQSGIYVQLIDKKRWNLRQISG